jgi:ribosome-associated heat shock protein Hsp15
MDEVRIDKWLWATRVFKTRSQATDACRAGHLKIDGRSVKPSRPVRVGDVISASLGPLTRTVRVVALLDRRIGASLVPEHLEDLTPASEYARLREPGRAESGASSWPKGLGRPTKRQRRALERFWAPPEPGEP